MKIIVCGGRDYRDRIFLFDTLSYLNSKSVITILVHGGAKGADALAGLWANQNNIHCIVYPADWKQYKKAAGFIRNTEMIKSNLNARFLIAFPGGSGTNMAVGIAKTNKIEVIDFR